MKDSGLKGESSIPVIYILSTGRSGSTLLDLLLNVHSEMWTLGELDVFRHELCGENRPCGCGRTLQKCPFWSSVIPDLPLQNPINVDYFRETYNAGRVLRFPHVLDIIRGSVNPKRQDEADQFADVNANVLRAIKRGAQNFTDEKIEFVVDASKDVYRLFWLQRSPQLDLWILHLTKDPRGFVFSNLKDNPPSPLRKAVRMAGRWLVQNALMRHIGLNVSSSHYRLVRYEDLSRKPRLTLSEIWEWLGVDGEAQEQVEIRDAENHAVSGNDMRWREEDIYLDDAWRHELPRSFQHLVWAMTSLLARKLGYRKYPYWI
jgi:hypothetical protein